MPLGHQLCLVCAQPTSMWCGRCHSAWYCAPQHSHRDWPRHKEECIPLDYQAIYNATLPSEPVVAGSSADIPVDVQAILFLPEEERPRTIFVRCNGTYRASCPIPLLSEYFPNEDPDSILLTHGLNGETLRYPLHIWYSPNSLAKAAPVNRAIHHITAGGAPRSWCGTVVAFKFNGSRRHGYADAGPNDLPALSAYFLAHE
ncbi:hypothetical protein BD626DRAFT_398839 [Schizophyllum amplum]|uniref:MYND-type domain-containing protein n=1 Tax=Schizophyllum amplum TaxID=97359 RepID=A0A550CKQ3_9AGAR|nr:hypothetical protein BD626DRAFT_398839 [Auriculariopsis ampla]